MVSWGWWTVFRALGAVTLIQALITYCNLRALLPHSDEADQQPQGLNLQKPNDADLIQRRKISTADDVAVGDVWKGPMAPTGKLEPQPRKKPLYGDVGNLHEHARRRGGREAAKEDYAPATPSLAQGVNGYILALHQDVVPCHLNIAPWAYYRPDGAAYGGGISRGIWRVVDSDGISWALKAVEDGYEEWKWVEVEVMRLRLPFNFFVHSIFSTATFNFLVMPELPYGNLWKVIQAEGEWSAQRRLRPLSAQIAFGLWELNQRGMYHSDVKPPNIMLLDERGENVTVIDYELVTYNCKRMKGRPCDDHIGAGTPSHMPLSQWTQGHGFSYEIDWWAFGVIFHTMMYGTYPFGAKGVKTSEEKLWTDKEGLWESDPARAHVLEVTIGAKYFTYLETPAGRQALETHLPEEHPVLGLDFWLGAGVPADPVARTQALRSFWRGVCVNHTLNPARQCAELFQPKLTMKVHPENCPQVDSVECCCKAEKCVEGSGEVGVDMELALESAAGWHSVCCLRRRSCGHGYPYHNSSFAGALCQESWMHEQTYPDEIDNSDEDPGLLPAARVKRKSPTDSHVDGGSGGEDEAEADDEDFEDADREEA